MIKSRRFPPFDKVLSILFITQLVLIVVGIACGYLGIIFPPIQVLAVLIEIGIPLFWIFALLHLIDILNPRANVWAAVKRIFWIIGMTLSWALFLALGQVGIYFLVLVMPLLILIGASIVLLLFRVGIVFFMRRLLSNSLD